MAVFGGSESHIGAYFSVASSGATNCTVNNKLLQGVLTSDEGEFSEIDEMAEDFDNAVYDSKLADRKELHLGNKWNQKTDLKKVLFNSKRTLKKAVVLKEILDRPLALRE